MAKFSLPGQTKSLDPNAADTDALTLFYKSLHEQRPESEMASRWLLQHGLLPEEEAARLVKLYGKCTASSKGNGAAKSPTKRKAADVKKAKATAAKAPARKNASQGKDSTNEDSSSEEPAKSSRSSNPKGKKAPEAQKAAQPRPKKPAMDSSDEDVPLSQKRGNGAAAPR